MNKFRPDGTFVITIKGFPYHVIEDDIYYRQILADFTTNPQNYEADETDTMKYQNGHWVDISDTDAYKAKVLAAENGVKKADLQLQINELDKKRIRAIAEPSQKDENTTWLEYYTNQIQTLRLAITGL